MTPLERLKELTLDAYASPATTGISREEAILSGSVYQLLPELLALWEAVNEWTGSWEGSAEEETLIEAKIALNARAEEIMK